MCPALSDLSEGSPGFKAPARVTGSAAFRRPRRELTRMRFRTSRHSSTNVAGCNHSKQRVKICRENVGIIGTFRHTSSFARPRKSVSEITKLAAPSDARNELSAFVYHRLHLLWQFTCQRALITQRRPAPVILALHVGAQVPRPDRGLEPQTTAPGVQITGLPPAPPGKPGQRPAPSAVQLAGAAAPQGRPPAIPPSPPGVFRCSQDRFLPFAAGLSGAGSVSWLFRAAGSVARATA